MAKIDNELDTDMDDDSTSLRDSRLSKKKLMIILIPILAIIGIVGFYYKSTSDKKSDAPLNYSIVQRQNEDNKTSYTILYDLPEQEIRLRGSDDNSQILRIHLSIELSDIKDIPTIDGLLSKFSDTIISHVIGLSPEEINGSESIYWLRKELLYRMNLLAAPVVITNINFKNFELLKG